MIFSEEQVSCICRVLLKERRYVQLEELLNLPCVSYLKDNLEFMEDGPSPIQQEILLAIIYLLQYKRNFDKFFQLMCTSPFSKKYHPELQQLWNQVRIRFFIKKFDKTILLNFL